MSYIVLTSIGRIVFNHLIYSTKEYFLDKQNVSLWPKNIVFCANHTTDGDGYILHSLLSKYCHLKTLMMAEFWDTHPGLGPILKQIDVCPIHRNDMLKALKETKECINYFKQEFYDCKGMLVFPDGEHVNPCLYNTNQYRESVELGAFFIAIKSQASVIPIFIEPNRFWWDCIIVIGNPIDSRGMNAENLKNEYVKQINILYEYAISIANNIYNRPLNEYRIETSYHCKDTRIVDMDPNIERVKNWTR